MTSTVRLQYDAENQALVLHGADERISRNPFFAAYFRQARGTRMPDGTLQLPASAEELSERFRSLSKVLERLGGRVERSEHVSTALDQIEIEEQRFSAFSRAANEIWHAQFETADFREFVRVVALACPNRTFYRKQLLAAYHLAFSQNACNFSVPGAGKTSVVYAAYAYLKSLPEGDPKFVDRLLIVGPLSSFKAWEDEFAAIFGRAPRAKRISGALSHHERADYLRGIDFSSRNVEITLTSYPTLASSVEDFRRFLSQSDHRTMMVLDEAHYIKRDDGVWSAAALRLAPDARSRVVLTGTPAPNGYEDLYNLFKFIYPSRSIISFPLSSLRAMSDGAMTRAIPQLKSSIQPFFTRIRKSDLGLPHVVEERVAIRMSDTQQRIYRSLERRIVPQLRGALDKEVAPLRVKARLIRLRQASVNPELLLRPLEDEGIFDTGDTGDFSIGEMEVANLVRAFDSTHDLERLVVCQALVERLIESQGKVLIWSYFLGNLQRLRSTFVGRVPFVEVLTGATPVAGDDEEDAVALGTREEIIDRFHRPGERAVLIANPQAVGESISLHKACRSAIYFDRDFNAGRFIQSKDRIHRYNPDGGRDVHYYYLVASDTVDADIDTRLQVKERRMAALVDSDDIPLFTADADTGMEDLREILDAYERRKTN